MKSAWSEREAAEFVERYAAEGIGEDLALRVYTTRLLGSEPRLVMHGGGNTSVKGRARDVTGAELDVLYVKGSGWDMGTIEPPGLPAVQLDPLLGLAEIDALSDEDMVNLQRRNLLDSTAPNPCGSWSLTACTWEESGSGAPRCSPTIAKRRSSGGG